MLKGPGLSAMPKMEMLGKRRAQARPRGKVSSWATIWSGVSERINMEIGRRERSSTEIGSSGRMGRNTVKWRREYKG
jgi:hypothetical protein